VIVGLIHEKTSLADAAVRERITQQFLSSAQAQANVIDDRFFRDERILAELSAAATEAIAHADTRSAERAYYSEEFAKSATAPADLAPSEFYRRPISLEWPVMKLAPGVARTDVDRDVRVLGLLRPKLQSALEAGVPGDDRSTRALRATFAKSGGEVARAFISLESGVHSSYPGVEGFQEQYDPRKRPKYRLAAHQKGIRWGNPYWDPFGLGIMLPASTALYSREGEFLGVAGIVTTFDHIRKNLLGLPGQRAIDEAMLVDDEGRIVTSTKDEHDAAAMTAPSQSDSEAELPVELRPIAFPSVIDSIEKRRSGYVTVDMPAGERMVTFFRLASLGWYYVLVADPDTLMAAS